MASKKAKTKKTKRKKGEERRDRGRPEKLIDPIPGPLENILRAMVRPVRAKS